MCVCGWEWLGVGFGGGGASGSRIVRAVLAACSAVPRRIPLCRPSHPPHRPTRRHDAHVLTLFCILRLWTPSSLSRHSSFSTSVPSFPTLHSSSSTTVPPPPPPHTRTLTLTHTHATQLHQFDTSFFDSEAQFIAYKKWYANPFISEQCNLCVYSGSCAFVSSVHRVRSSVQPGCTECTGCTGCTGCTCLYMVCTGCVQGVLYTCGLQGVLRVQGVYGVYLWCTVCTVCTQCALSVQGCAVCYSVWHEMCPLARNDYWLTSE